MAEKFAEDARRERETRQQVGVPAGRAPYARDPEMPAELWAAKQRLVDEMTVWRAWSLVTAGGRQLPGGASAAAVDQLEGTSRLPGRKASTFRRSAGPW